MHRNHRSSGSMSKSASKSTNESSSDSSDSEIDVQETPTELMPLLKNLPPLIQTTLKTYKAQIAISEKLISLDKLNEYFNNFSSKKSDSIPDTESELLPYLYNANILRIRKLIKIIFETSENSFAALRENLIHFDDIISAGMQVNAFSLLMTNDGMFDLRKSLVTNHTLPYLKIILSKFTIEALQENLLTIKQAQLFTDDNVLRLLFSSRGKFALEHKLLTVEQVLRAKLNLQQLTLLLTPHGLIALSKGLGKPDGPIEKLVEEIKIVALRKTPAGLTSNPLITLQLSEDEISSLRKSETERIQETCTKVTFVFGSTLKSKDFIYAINSMLDEIDELINLHLEFFPRYTPITPIGFNLIKMQILEKAYRDLTISQDGKHRILSDIESNHISDAKSIFSALIKKCVADPALNFDSTHHLEHKYVRPSLLLQCVSKKSYLFFGQQDHSKELTDAITLINNARQIFRMPNISNTETTVRGHRSTSITM